MGRKTSIVLLLLACGILLGAIIAGIGLSPEACHHYHWSC